MASPKQKIALAKGKRPKSKQKAAKEKKTKPKPQVNVPFEPETGREKAVAKEPKGKANKKKIMNFYNPLSESESEDSYHHQNSNFKAENKKHAMAKE